MNKILNIINNELTIVIVTYYSDWIIFDCINNLNIDSKIIVIENSNNIELKKKLGDRFKNVECIINETNLGVSKAWNIGIKKSKTNYVLVLNPDTFPQKNCIELLTSTAINNPNAGIIFPLSVNNENKISDEYGIFKKDSMLKIKQKEKIFEIEWCNGNSFLLNKSNFNEIGFFDEKFFFNYEETDLCKRLINNKKKIFINTNAKTKHLEGKSSDIKYKKEIRLHVLWHRSWSHFYYLKKHFGYLTALKKTLPLIILSIFKIVIFIFLFRTKKIKPHFFVIHGFLNAYLGKDSYHRAKIES